ncbi:hypothetical protein H9Q69_000657 [Fusarium xylarioides]|uniref:Uncharacterized protein n=1 Tax=Fusarium xylarioides TaxID=221167 RepID=A0A9P7LQ20_9HYPO|nr:hypothetical protein H9Q70_000875 [Fusarium xylarioides]KAG5771184.1 hypothetical protein H9Q72_002177 [Fusarium xylarioides]KAG5800359.1 hypothetical protein H9Q69_000657 [Fusarium xylarioides]KAG5820862.1 hypothetical protein H9Q71_000414 [Fusarium xylarioides]KAG5829477.1 hypothetical protein H9Q74_000420 [Fusarium xylarioides]
MVPDRQLRPLELNITADTTKFYRMPKSATSYQWEEGFSAEQHLSHIQDAPDAYTNNGAGAPPGATDILYIATTRNNDKMTDRSDPASASLHEMGNSSPEELSLSAPIPTSPDKAIDCVRERGTTKHTLTPVEVEGGVKAVVVAKSDTVALVVEARVAKGVDGNTCAPGVLLHTVDTALATSEGSIKVLDATPGSNGCGDDNGAEPLNDGTLSMDGKKSFEASGWGVKATLIDDKNDQFNIEVQYS